MNVAFRRSKGREKRSGFVSDGSDAAGEMDIESDSVRERDDATMSRGGRALSRCQERRGVMTEAKG